MIKKGRQIFPKMAQNWKNLKMLSENVTFFGRGLSLCRQQRAPPRLTTPLSMT